MIALQKRADPSRMMSWLAPLIALGITVLAGLVMFAMLGVPVGAAFHAFFIAVSYTHLTLPTKA